MSVFQLIMLLASAYFAFKIYEHIQTLQDGDSLDEREAHTPSKAVDAFSPFDAEALVEKADEAFSHGDEERALAFLNEANAKDGNNPDILYKIGYILQHKNDYEAALEYYKKSLSVEPKNEFAHNSIASVYRANGEYSSAKLHLNASLDIDSANPITYYNYGNLLVDMHKNDEAIVMYEKAVELDPKFHEAAQELEKLKEK